MNRPEFTHLLRDTDKYIQTFKDLFWQQIYYGAMLVTKVAYFNKLHNVVEIFV